MAELRDIEAERSFLMSLQGNSWLPQRQDAVQPCSESVVIKHVGKQQTIYMVSLP